MSDLGRSHLLCDSTANEAVWLALRRNYLTASDVGAVLGLLVDKTGKPYKTREQVIEEKVYGSSFKGNRKTWWGKQEEGHMVYILSQLGLLVTLDGGLYSGGDRLAATLDARVVGHQEAVATPDQVSSQPEIVAAALKAMRPGDLLEFKLMGYYPTKDKMPVPPPYYVAQCQAAMAVTGAERCLLVARVGAHDLIPCVVRADAVYQNRIRLAAKQVMDAVDKERAALEQLGT